jgi:catechol 2,3-dioxygenase-like lactoylglutathione lyase family enzyme
VLASWVCAGTQGTVGRVKTLHTAYRVTDLAASLDFYTALGYGQVRRVDIGDGASLTMLSVPGEEVVTLELVHRPTNLWTSAPASATSSPRSMISPPRSRRYHGRG